MDQMAWSCIRVAAVTVEAKSNGRNIPSVALMCGYVGDGNALFKYLLL